MLSHQDIKDYPVNIGRQRDAECFFAGEKHYRVKHFGNKVLFKKSSIFLDGLAV